MSEVAPLFDQLANCKVLIIGDVMLDRYLRGRVDRVSPEAPVPVVQLQSAENRLGGAANVALNIKAMGAKPILCSVIGDDENGRLFQELLPQSDISAQYLFPSAQRPTTVKTRVIAANQHLLRVDSESTLPLAAQEEGQLMAIIRKVLDQQDIQVILFQDYNKGVLTQSLIRDIQLEALKQDIPTAVDPKFNNFFEYKRCTLFKPNLKEIREAFGQSIAAKRDSLDEATADLKDKLDHQYTLITLSEKGVYFHDGHRSEILSTQARKISDVCGAGDTVISVATLALAAGLPLRDIGLLANLAGGQVCESVGVVPVNRMQLEREYTQLLAKLDTSI